MKMKPTKRESEEDFDVDQDVLDRILNKLYDFGDDKKSKKKHKNRKRLKQEEEEDVTAEEENLDKLDCEKDNTNVTHVTDSDERPSTSTSADSRGVKRKAPAVEIVTFQDPRKKNKLKRAAEAETKPAEEKEKKKKKKEPDVLSMEKARLDVHRFGITGFQKQQQRVFEQDRAIMLGARPPKRNYVNYKEYQQVIKEKKLKEKQEEAKGDIQKKKKKSSVKQKSMKRKPGSSGAEPTGHVGRFKNGMLVLSTKDIQKLKSKKRK